MIAIKKSEMERSEILVNINNGLGSAWLHIEIETGEVGPVDLDVSVFVVVCRADESALFFRRRLLWQGGTGRPRRPSQANP